MDALGKLRENLPPVAYVIGADLPAGILTWTADKVYGGS
jgi:hypothetical protein